MNSVFPTVNGAKHDSLQGSFPSTIQKTSFSGDTDTITSFQLQAEVFHSTSAENTETVETAFYQDELSTLSGGEYQVGFHHPVTIGQQSNELQRKPYFERNGSHHTIEKNVPAQIPSAPQTVSNHPQISIGLEANTKINIETKPLLSNLQTAHALNASQVVEGQSNTLSNHSLTNTDRAQISSEWASIKVDPQASKWGHQMLQVLHDRVSFQAQQNLQEAKIRLDPPELGKLDVIVRVEGDRLNVQLNASSMATREALNQVSERLRAELQDQNFVHVDVNVGAERDQQPYSEQQSSDDSLHIRAAHPQSSEQHDNTQSDHWLNTHA